MKKLQDLLNTNPSNQRDLQRSASLSRSLPHNPADFCPTVNNFGPIQSGQGTFKSLPIPSNIFYHPSIKNDDPSHPSPMIRFSGFQGLRENNPLFFASSRMDQQNLAANMTLNGNSELLNSLSSLNSLNTLGSLTSLLQTAKLNATAQPKNLNELLQRSFTSTHSNSLVQSQSPFLSSQPNSFGAHNYIQSPYVQNQVCSDYSNTLTSTVLGTPVQNSNFMRNQMMNHQQPENTNEALLRELTNLLKQDNGENIKAALGVILQGYDGEHSRNRQVNSQGFPYSNGLTNLQGGNQNVFQQQGMLGANPRTISLSNGFTMNSVNRNIDTKPNGYGMNVPRSNRFINTNMGRDGILSNESSVKKGNYSIIPEEDSSLMGEMSFSQGSRQPNSPSQNLNSKLNKLTINSNHSENPREMSFSRKLPVDQELSAILEERIMHDKEAPGAYNREERTNKILKYKNKIRKWRKEHPVNRNFKGRSVVAGKKPRIKGKFVTIDEYVEYIKTTNQDEYDHGSQANEYSNEISTYVGSDKISQRT